MQTPDFWKDLAEKFESIEKDLDPSAAGIGVPSGAAIDFTWKITGFGSATNRKTAAVEALAREGGIALDPETDSLNAWLSRIYSEKINRGHDGNMLRQNGDGTITTLITTRIDLVCDASVTLCHRLRSLAIEESRLSQKPAGKRIERKISAALKKRITETESSTLPVSPPAPVAIASFYAMRDAEIRAEAEFHFEQTLDKLRKERPGPSVTPTARATEPPQKYTERTLADVMTRIDPDLVRAFTEPIGNKILSALIPSSAPQSVKVPAEESLSNPREEADAISPLGETDTRTILIRSFQQRGRALGFRITDKMIANAANSTWNDRTPVTWWKRADKKCSPAHNTLIPKLLQRDPSEIWPDKVKK